MPTLCGDNRFRFFSAALRSVDLDLCAPPLTSSNSMAYSSSSESLSPHTPAAADGPAAAEGGAVLAAGSGAKRCAFVTLLTRCVHNPPPANPDQTCH